MNTARLPPNGGDGASQAGDGYGDRPIPAALCCHEAPDRVSSWVGAEWGGRRAQECEASGSGGAAPTDDERAQLFYAAVCSEASDIVFDAGQAQQLLRGRQTPAMSGSHR